MAAQGRQVSQQMREQLDSFSAMRRDQLRGIQNAQQAEAQNRSDNFQFEQSTRELHQKDVERNQQRSLEQLKQPGVLDAVVNLSNTAAKQLVKVHEERGKRDRAEGLMMAYKEDICRAPAGALQISS